MSTETSPKNNKPKYDLTPKEVSALESELADLIVEKTGDQEEVYAIWMGSDSRFADILRAQEKFFGMILTRLWHLMKIDHLFWHYLIQEEKNLESFMVLDFQLVCQKVK